MTYTFDDGCDAFRDLIANAQDGDLTDADLGRWVRLYCRALEGMNPAAVREVVEALSKCSDRLKDIVMGEGLHPDDAVELAHEADTALAKLREAE